MAVHLKTYPLTPDRWKDFTTLFGERGACGGCWCMTWRVMKSDFEKQKGEGNKRAMHSLVKRNKLPGIIGYIDNEPVGWCAVAPREEYPRLNNSRVLRSPDDEPVWSVTCFFIRKDFRKQGLSVQLLKGVIDFCKTQGAKIIEAYPQEPKQELPAAFVWTGLTSSFKSAGFKEVARFSPVRPIMRIVIK